MGGGDLRSAFHADQFGPDQVPVVRSQVPAFHNATGNTLDLGAPLRRYATSTIQPIPNVLLLYPNGRSKCCLASDRINSNLKCVHG